MYLISESDNRILQQARNVDNGDVVSPIETSIDQISKRMQASPETKQTNDVSIDKLYDQYKSIINATPQEEDKDETMEKLHERYKRLINVSNIPTPTPQRCTTPPSIIRATPFVLPPPTYAANKPRKTKCKDQLAECKTKLDKCMKILRWQTVDGTTFTAGKPSQVRLDFSTPAMASTPLINKQKTPQQKRMRKAPNHYTPL